MPGRKNYSDGIVANLSANKLRTSQIINIYTYPLMYVTQYLKAFD